MAQLLVKRADSVNTAISPLAQESDLYKAGDIVEVREDGSPIGGSEVDYFFWILLPGVSAELVRHLMSESWSAIEVQRRAHRRRFNLPDFSALPVPVQKKITEIIPGTVYEVSVDLADRIQDYLVDRGGSAAPLEEI